MRGGGDRRRATCGARPCLASTTAQTVLSDPSDDPVIKAQSRRKHHGGNISPAGGCPYIVAVVSKVGLRFDGRGLGVE